VITKAECPHCSRLFCALCKVGWHDGVVCAEFQRLGKDDLLLRKVAKDKKWQRSPKCNMYVERVDGCVYMVCRYSPFAAFQSNYTFAPRITLYMAFFSLHPQNFRCRYRFCYLCGSPMTKGDHRCSRCKRTW
jgi:E3 ubiquitin-protein ligase RNF144